MTFPLYLIGVYFGAVAVGALVAKLPFILPAVMTVYFLGNTPLSKAITEPLPWHMTFLGIDLLMMFYCMTFQTTAMNIAAIMFCLSAVLYMFIMMHVQWAARLHGFFAMLLVVFITVSVSAHIAIEANL